MTFDPFWWLRLLMLAVIALLSFVFGIEPGFDPRTASVGDLFQVIVETTDEGIQDRGGLEALAEIEDEPLDEIDDEPLTELPPLDDHDGTADNGGVPGGVIGGGVAEGPDTSENPVPEPTLPPAAPTATVSQFAPTATAVPTSTPAATTTPTATASPTGTSVATATAIATATATPDPAMLRLNDPVLRWLPELRAASSATGVPVSVLAALVQVESGGDPNPIGTDTGRGLTGVPENVLTLQGWSVDLWHDPATNVFAGASSLVSFGAGGDWDAALRLAWGADCDLLGQCAGLYAYAVAAWAGYYAPIVANPQTSGILPLPLDWIPPDIAPSPAPGPRPIVLPPGVPAPTATTVPTSTPVPTETPAPTETSSPTDTPVPTETPVPPVEGADVEGESSPMADQRDTESGTTPTGRREDR